MIVLNVGGFFFTTSRETLELQEGYFRSLIQSNEDSYFIDRDGTHFRHVLNYLRGSSVVPSDRSALEELLTEADYFGLVGLKLRIEHRLQSTETVAAELRAIRERLTL